MNNLDFTSNDGARYLTTALGGGPLFVSLLQDLARGEPVEIATAAASYGVDVGRMKQLLEPLPVERDERGRVIGLGLTLEPTPHTFDIGGKRLYTWCALDALLFPSLLGVTAHVTSPCAETGTLVTVTVGPDGVHDVAPRDARVVLVTPTEGADLRDTFCSKVSFFASEAAAQASCARSLNAGAHVMTVEEGFLVGQRLIQLWASGDTGCCAAARDPALT